jgi:hypothetical protein
MPRGGGSGKAAWGQQLKCKGAISPGFCNSVEINRA